MWGQRFGAAAELPLGAERHVRAGSAGNLSPLEKNRKGLHAPASEWGRRPRLPPERRLHCTGTI